MQTGTGNNVPAAAAAAPGANLAAAPTDVTFGPIIQQLHVLDGLQRNQEKAHAELLAAKDASLSQLANDALARHSANLEELAAKDKELDAQHAELMQARSVVESTNIKALQRKQLAEHLVICMLLCSLLLLVRCLSSAS